MAAYAVTFAMMESDPMYGMRTLLYLAEMDKEMREIMIREGSVEHIVRAMKKNVADHRLVATGAYTFSYLVGCGEIPESQVDDLLRSVLLPTLCDTSCPSEAVTMVLFCIRSIASTVGLPELLGEHIVRVMHTHCNKVDVQIQGCAALASMIRSDADAVVLINAGAHKTALNAARRHAKNEKVLEYAHMLLHNISI